MKKTLYVGGSMVLALLMTAGPMVSVANAQTYVYPNTSFACLALTNYQALGTSDVTTGGQVTQLQQFLNRTGYLSGVSGTFDNGTLGAVVNFQRAFGIPQTGTVGPETRLVINSQSCSGSNVNYSGGYTNGYVNNYYPNTNYNTYPYTNYYSAPVVTSYSTSAASTGSSVTVYGSNFLGTNPTVHFGNSTIAASGATNNSLTFIVPAFTTGTYAVYVSTSYGSSNTTQFTITSNCSNTLYYNGYSSYNTNYYNNGSSCNNCQSIVYGSSYYNNGSYLNNCGTNYNNGSYYNGYPSGMTWYGTTGMPQISSVSGPASVSTGSTNNYYVYAYSRNGLPVTVRADWGDNTTSQNSSSYTSSQQQYSFSHVYNAPGTYTIRMTATDTNGGYSYSTQQVYVSGNSYYYGNNTNYNYNTGYNYTNPGYNYSYSY